MAAVTDPSGDDPFATAAIRRRVLEAWAASPARFREDANAEEDLVRGGYRDRLLVELAQNAADAAVRAGVAGRLRLTLADDVLRAANTGAPLDADGVQALATLRASAKRDEAAVGRFGVGFAAVLAVSDDPAVFSTSGGVRFSAAQTRTEVAGIGSLGAEVARRDGAVPVLRLPWPADGAVPEGFATEVVLPLRAGTRAGVHDALGSLTAELLLALDGLEVVEVAVDGAVRELSRDEARDGRVRLVDDGVATTWQVARRSGKLPPELVADRPVEERERRGWTLTWAVPLDDDGRPRPLPVPQAVHAPTPSDEPLSLPVRLVAPFPLGPDRRHVLPGPVTDALVEQAAATYAELLDGLPDDPAVLALVPRIGLAGAELDAALGTAALDRLRQTPWLPGELLPERAAVLEAGDDRLVAALTGVVPGLLPAEWSGASGRPALTALGVRRLSTADVVEAVRGIDRPPSWWATLYAALDVADREELGGLPVPLADGRTAHGPVGVLLPDPDLPVERLGPLHLRLAHPDAVATPGAMRVLERLGARPASAAAVLADDAVRSAVEGSMDALDELDGPPPVELAAAVLALVAAAGVRPGELPWLAELALPDADGGWAPAGELVLPGSPLADVLAPDALGVLDAESPLATDRDALRAAGVLETFALVRADDPDDLDVDLAADWADAVVDRLPAGAPPPRWPELTAVRDLELVVDWPRALALLAALPAGARDDVMVGGVRAPGYLRWWLRTHPVLDGRRPDRLRSPDGAELQGLYEPAEAPDDVLDLVAPPASIADVLADVDGALDLLDRLGDPALRVRPEVLRTVYARLATALDGVDADPPKAARVGPDRVARDAVVLDLPWLQPLVDRPMVPAGGAPGPVADLLDLPLASEVVTAVVESRPDRVTAWADLPGAVLAATRLGLDRLDGEVDVHERLVAGGREVAWWVDGSRPAVDGSAAALGRALAWTHGAWHRRQALAEAFAESGRADLLAAEDGVGDR